MLKVFLRIYFRKIDAAIRIPSDDFCFELIQKFKGAIVSTSANISGEESPKQFSDISNHIKNNADYIVNL